MNKLQGRVTSIVVGGLGLVQAEKQTILVRHAVSGDQLILTPPQKKHHAFYAEIQELLQASEQRVQAPCSMASACGGCALQYLDRQAHAAVKSAWVYDAFQGVVNHTSQWQPIIDSDIWDDDYKRRRLRWHVAHDEDGKVVLGFRAYQSHEVIEMPSCMVITSPLNDLRLALQEAMQTFESLPIAVYAVQLSDGIHVVFIYENKAEQTVPAIQQWQGLPIQFWYQCDGITRPLQKPVQVFHDSLPTMDDTLHIQIGADDFVQGQYAGNQAMIEQILAWSEGAGLIVDLFAGVGNLSLPLAASGMRVLGAEVHEASVRAANKNAKILQLDAHYQQVDLFADFHAADFVGADILIVDPPRKGAKKICGMMNYLLPKKAILVHCDVASAKRDAQIMQQQGYHLQGLRALDLFPYSGHVESMSLWAH